MAKPPSPCIDVCKYKREGRCIGCAMTKAEKKRFKDLRKGERAAFVSLLTEMQDRLGGYSHWADAYRRKCRKKGKPCVLDAGQKKAA